MSQTLTNFDVIALLDSDEAINEYLSQVLADGDNEEFLRAIGYVLKARGMTHQNFCMGRVCTSESRASKRSCPRHRFYAQPGHAIGCNAGQL
jgi:hypothetical protein